MEILQQISKKEFKKLAIKLTQTAISYNEVSRQLNALNELYGPLKFTMEHKVPDLISRQNIIRYSAITEKNFWLKEIPCVWINFPLPIVDNIDYGTIQARLPIDFDATKAAYILVEGGNFYDVRRLNTDSSVIHPNIFNKYFSNLLHICLGTASRPLYFSLKNLDFLGATEILYNMFNQPTLQKDFFFSSILRKLKRCSICDSLPKQIEIISPSNRFENFICQDCQ